MANKQTAAVFAAIIAKWWESRRPKSRGNIAGGLVLLENLRDNCILDIVAHKTAGSDQLKNATVANVQRILARHEEKRTLLKEGGRTNRGLMKNLADLLQSLSDGGINQLPAQKRKTAIDGMQSFLAQKAQESLNAPAILFPYRAGMMPCDIVSAILEAAREKKKAGEVAEYLVGAKLALRFPDYEIRNSAASAADDQTAAFGDFQINDSVFHITIAPNEGHYRKCGHNLAGGLRVFLLVPDKHIEIVRETAGQKIIGRIAVRGIESFVSQNIEELAEFSGKRIVRGIAALLEKYNERVARVETDLSLMIKIPPALRKK